jgi:hypothetical protein
LSDIWIAGFTVGFVWGIAVVVVVLLAFWAGKSLKEDVDDTEAKQSKVD